MPNRRRGRNTVQTYSCCANGVPNTIGTRIVSLTPCAARFGSLTIRQTIGGGGRFPSASPPPRRLVWKRQRQRLHVDLFLRRGQSDDFLGHRRGGIDELRL